MPPQPAAAADRRYDAIEEAAAAAAAGRLRLFLICICRLRASLAGERGRPVMHEEVCRDGGHDPAILLLL